MCLTLTVISSILIWRATERDEIYLQVICFIYNFNRNCNSTNIWLFLEVFLSRRAFTLSFCTFSSWTTNFGWTTRSSVRACFLCIRCFRTHTCSSTASTFDLAFSTYSYADYVILVVWSVSTFSISTKRLLFIQSDCILCRTWCICTLCK